MGFRREEDLNLCSADRTAKRMAIDDAPRASVVCVSHKTVCVQPVADKIISESDAEAQEYRIGLRDTLTALDGRYAAIANRFGDFDHSAGAEQASVKFTDDERLQYGRTLPRVSQIQPLMHGARLLLPRHMFRIRPR